MDGEAFELSPDKSGEGHKVVNLEESKFADKILDDQAEDGAPVTDPLMQGLASEVVAQEQDDMQQHNNSNEPEQELGSEVSP